MKRALLSLAFAAVVAPLAAAQFSQFEWTLNNPQNGFADVTDISMGLWGTTFSPPGSTISYTTQSSASGRVQVTTLVMPEDGVCSGGGSTALLIVNGLASGYASCFFSGTLTFDVAENSTFGFGLTTFNTSWPYSTYYSDFTFTPYWSSLPGAMAGSNGTPLLSGFGILQPGQNFGIRLTSAKPNAAVALVVGLSTANLPFKGGVMVPDPLYLIPGLASSAGGTLILGSVWPTGLLGTPLVMQAWISDAGGPLGFAASNALQGSQL